MEKVETESEAVNLGEGFKAENLVKVGSEFSKYLPHIENILKEIVAPNYTADGKCLTVKTQV